MAVLFVFVFVHLSVTLVICIKNDLLIERDFGTEATLHCCCIAISGFGFSAKYGYCIFCTVYFDITANYWY